jgi:serine/threonine protein phosphatase 1
MAKTWVIGDIRGQYEKLQKCLELADINFDFDTVVQLGDIVDRGPEPFKCLDLLLKINNVVFIRGNHDEEFAQSYLLNQRVHFNGHHGAHETITAWHRLDIEQQAIVKDWFLGSAQKDYYVDAKKRLFIHGGFDRHRLLTEQSKTTFYWDRDLLASAITFDKMKYEDGKAFKFKIKEKFKEIFIGHTPAIVWDSDKPMGPLCGKLWNLDTGSGRGGKLTIMDIDSKQYWQS